MDGLNGPGKAKTFFSDFTTTDTGLQYKDYKPGSGPNPARGDRVTLEWTGVTVGYQGRYFETRNKPKGGAVALELRVCVAAEGTELSWVRMRSAWDGSGARLASPGRAGHACDTFT